jgi:hypothetical protein
MPALRHRVSERLFGSSEHVLSGGNEMDFPPARSLKNRNLNRSKYA